MKLASLYSVGMSVWCRIGGQWLEGTISRVGKAYLTVLGNDRGFSMSLKPENVRFRNTSKHGADRPEEVA